MDQVWRLQHEGREHRVEATGSWSRRLRWYVDDVLVAERSSSEDRARLTAKEQPGLGSVLVRFNGLGRPRRATVFGAQDAATSLAGVGGVDLVPEPGSAAADHEDKVRRHPRRHTVLAVATGAATVVLPLVVAYLVARLAVDLPWPDWDLPDVPFPDLPRLPRPDWDLPDWSLPGWVRWTLDRARYVVPVLVAAGLARAEIRRRRAQDALRVRRGAERQSEDGRD